ncbi:MAG TPA: protein translocase subunit SecF [Candidatus Paceibacterota bacterium]|nr:protein translocase subunit SecF [Candidatus Paceibacterota bacterium]
MQIISHKHIFLGIAAAIMVVSIGIIAVLGLRLGIDFTGGSLTEASYVERPEKAAVETALDDLSLELGAYSLRESTNDAGQPAFNLRTRDLTEPERQTVSATLTGLGVDGAVTRFTSIGPTIGQELRDKAVWAIGAVAAVIILYVAWAFRGVGRPVGSWTYGGITILALIHDVLVPTAVMAVLGVLIGAEVDVLFVMALLAVLGYSVNDTIVVFDRVRENLLKFRQEKKVMVKNEYGQPEEQIEYIPTKPFAEVVGLSIDQTILRSINTSLTTLFALSALYFLGGSVTQTFALVLMAGVLAGTYSSIFFANPLLVLLAERNAQRAAAKDAAVVE